MVRMNGKKTLCLTMVICFSMLCHDDAIKILDDQEERIAKLMGDIKQMLSAG